MKFLDLSDVIHKTTMSRSYIMARKNGFPAGRKIEGKRDLVWLESEVEEWMCMALEQSAA